MKLNDTKSMVSNYLLVSSPKLKHIILPLFFNHISQYTRKLRNYVKHILMKTKHKEGNV